MNDDTINVYEQIKILLSAAETLANGGDRRKDVIEKLNIANKIMLNEIKRLDNNSRVVYPPTGFGSKYIDKPFTSTPSFINRTNTLERVYITNHLYLDAKKVKTFTQVQTMGELYYVENCKHFAIKIFDVLLHGNIGKIYDKFEQNKGNNKIKPCKYGKHCTNVAKCGFYHDPTINFNSTDTRNYIAENFIYTPPFKNKRLRKFGSIDNLDTDIILLSEENIDEMADQTMHELLCTLILKKYYKRL